MSRDDAIKYLTPDNLHEQLKQFTAGMSVTKGSYELLVDQCTLADAEWNHMDQMHRLTIHKTYEKAVRIASGKNFALSLTQWQKWPLFITVTDVQVGKGLFYQTMSIAGIVVVHIILTLEAIGESVNFKIEWYIASHKFFRFLHRFLNKKLYNLNKRLQIEDEQLRQGRYQLRKQGYCFKTDSPDYYNSNVLGRHTVYPQLVQDSNFSVEDLSDEPTLKSAGTVNFIVKKENPQRYLIWPAACPHEGGPLLNGNFCGLKITCPWHGLQFAAAILSEETSQDTKHGFEYSLIGQTIYVRQSNVTEMKSKLVESEAI